MNVLPVLKIKSKNFFEQAIKCTYGIISISCSSFPEPGLNFITDFRHLSCVLVVYTES